MLKPETVSQLEGDYRAGFGPSQAARRCRASLGAAMKYFRLFEAAGIEPGPSQRNAHWRTLRGLPSGRAPKPKPQPQRRGRFWRVPRYDGPDWIGNSS
jgi:hypothetical protein